MSRIKLIFAICAVTFTTILIEILYTRVYSVLYFGQFAFLIISLALFGYGLSGVFVSLSKIGKRTDARGLISLFLILYALSILMAYKITLFFSIDFLNLLHPLKNLLYLIINFLANLLPFFFAGTTLVLIFSNYSSEIGKLYFIDLVGASLGSLAIVPLVPLLGPSRIIIFIFLLLTVCWLLFSQLNQRRKAFLLALFVAATAGMVFYENVLFPIIPKYEKRFYNVQLANKRIEYSRWNTINRIDVAPWPWDPPRKIVYINGGTMQSFMYQFNGDYDQLKPVLWDAASLPYQLAKSGSAAIIGSAGGYEVLCAVSHKFDHVLAIEMDPGICHILKHGYAPYTGNLFFNERVRLLADEGRSVLKRSKQKFDVIQMVNSHNTDTLLSGALSIAETYIYTVESFKDYWERLKPKGWVFIVHWYGERLFSTALRALKEMGIEDPGKKLFVGQRVGDFAYFFMKKGNISSEDIGILTAVFADNEICYSPVQQKDNSYYRMASLNGEEFISDSSVDISPVYDNSPYLNQANKIGQFKFSNMVVTGIGETIVRNGIGYSNSIYISILVLSVVFSLLFIFVPLGIQTGRIQHVSLVFYFFLIGLAFIMVEIIYIKIFQFFLGSPAISISIIIFSLLISTGIGSLFSNRLQALLKKRLIPIFALIVAAILSVYGLFLFKILNYLIDLEFIPRILVSLILISVGGFFMGHFFPFGIRYLGERNQTMIGWAWGANAFATVLGSILTVIISINWNFSLVLYSAAFCYLLSGVLILRKR